MSMLMYIIWEVLFVFLNFYLFLKLLSSVLVSSEQQGESTVCIYISPHSRASLPPSHFVLLGNHRSLSWAPCTIWQYPISCYTHGSVHISMFLSQLALPSSSPSLFCSLHLDFLFLPCKLVPLVPLVPFFRFHIYALIYDFFFSSIHINTNDQISLIFMAEYYFNMW